MNNTKNALQRQRNLRTARLVFTNIVRYFFLISLSYVVLYQIAYMASQAFKPQDQIYDPSVVWVPKSFTLYNIKDA